jgi:GDSL-like Lipase/Acylhydrolase family
MRGARRLASGVAVLSLGAVMVLVMVLVMRSRDARGAAGADGRVRVAVIGDSDSHAFQDTFTFGAGGTARGGALRASTLQWTEVLDRLRGTQVDLGRWGTFGHSGRIVRIASWVGLGLRTPRKMDFAFNTAFSGARCGSLAGHWGQVAQVARLLRASPAAWDRGAVVIRIGINDLGRREVLEAVVADGLGEAQRALIGDCTDAIIAGARALRAAHPRVGILLVGIADNANWPPNFERFRSPEAMQRLAALHDAFDDALRGFAAGAPQVAFLDDRAFFREHWGGRAADGTPAYRAVEIAGRRVSMSQGDAPEHAVLQDGHAGTIVNALFAQRLTELLATRLAAPVPPITDAELDTALRALLPR